MTLSAEHKKSLLNAAVKYHRSFPGSPAEKFLEDRGLPAERIGSLRFGYVDDPEPGHQQYRGMLAIPYLRRDLKDNWSVVSIRYRCIVDGCDHSQHQGKYLTMAGDKPRLYNTVSVVDNHDWVGITEGEIDAVTASIAGIPSVSVSGAKMWQDHYRYAFLGFEKVFVLADGDDAGKELGKKVAKSLPNAFPCPLPPGEDVNSFVVKNGVEGLRERIGLSC